MKKFKEWHHSKGVKRENAAFSEYAMAKRNAKKAVAKAQQKMKESW